MPCQAQTPAKAQARGVALVIGNAAYADRALPNPGNDAADVAQLPYPLLNHIVGRIVGEVKGVNRVLYDVTTKPPASIEWE